MSNWPFSLKIDQFLPQNYQFWETNDEYHSKGAEKEWGDGIRGLYLTTARYALYQIPKTKIHTKNYRPQLLVFLEFDENKEIINPEIISVARQLKAGKGLRNGV